MVEVDVHFNPFRRTEGACRRDGERDGESSPIVGHNRRPHRRHGLDSLLSAPQGPGLGSRHGSRGVDEPKAILDVVLEASCVRDPSALGRVVLLRGASNHTLHVTIREGRVGLEDERNHAGDNWRRVRGALPPLLATAIGRRDKPVVGVSCSVATRGAHEQGAPHRGVVGVLAELVHRADGDGPARVKILLVVDILTGSVLVAGGEDIHDTLPRTPRHDALLQEDEFGVRQVGELARHPEVRPRSAFRIRFVVGTALTETRDHSVASAGGGRRPVGGARR
mmetsp:Transcript_18450/g.48614  ORF Transcript_18450/g.48614 Transcript_18450/m.48614 type:complete len:280 (-) Transcript_18450:114-953(-)|eukprot:2342189-Prymnesium_polylepis.2